MRRIILHSLWFRKTWPNAPCSIPINCSPCEYGAQHISSDYSSCNRNEINITHTETQHYRACSVDDEFKCSLNENIFDSSFRSFGELNVHSSHTCRPLLALSLIRDHANYLNGNFHDEIPFFKHATHFMLAA